MSDKIEQIEGAVEPQIHTVKLEVINVDKRVAAAFKTGYHHLRDLVRRYMHLLVGAQVADPDTALSEEHSLAVDSIKTEISEHPDLTHEEKCNMIRALDNASVSVNYDAAATPAVLENPVPGPSPISPVSVPPSIMDAAGLQMLGREVAGTIDANKQVEEYSKKVLGISSEPEANPAPVAGTINFDTKSVEILGANAEPTTSPAPAAPETPAPVNNPVDVPETTGQTIPVDASGAAQ